jgi:hypothetical protein
MWYKDIFLPNENLIKESFLSKTFNYCISIGFNLYYLNLIQ